MRCQRLIASILLCMFAPVALADESPAYEVYDLHVDHLGSVRLVTREDGLAVAKHDFFPFGEEVMPLTDIKTKMFTGHERDDETGLDYMLARYYSDGLGRFLSVDPSRASVLPVAPQSWNRYSYAKQNPLAWIDPNGMVPFSALPDRNKNQVNSAARIVAPLLQDVFGAGYDPAFIRGHNYEYQPLTCAPITPAGVGFGFGMLNSRIPIVPLKGYASAMDLFGSEMAAYLFLAGYSRGEPGEQGFKKAIIEMLKRKDALGMDDNVLAAVISQLHAMLQEKRGWTEFFNALAGGDFDIDSPAQEILDRLERQIRKQDCMGTQEQEPPQTPGGSK